MRRKLVAGNWKMHGGLAQNQTLLKGILPGVSGLRTVDCAVCVPFPYLAQVQALLRDTAISLGAQNLSRYPGGAHTGEVSASMLRDFGCRYVIVGHSERRQICGEDNLAVAEKFRIAVDSGLTPIFCVGETLEQRDQGVTESVVAEQLDAVTGLVGAETLGKAVVAYEPVWAIGTGKTATPEQAQEVHAFIRCRIRALDGGVAESQQILYGGSVKGGNARELFAMPDIDGGLIGAASLKADEFVAICRAAEA